MPFSWNTSSGHSALSPLQCSARSQSFLLARQSTPAAFTCTENRDASAARMRSLLQAPQHSSTLVWETSPSTLWIQMLTLCY